MFPFFIFLFIHLFINDFSGSGGSEIAIVIVVFGGLSELFFEGQDLLRIMAVLISVAKR